MWQSASTILCILHLATYCIKNYDSRSPDDREVDLKRLQGARNLCLKFVFCENAKKKETKLIFNWILQEKKIEIFTLLGC